MIKLLNIPEIEDQQKVAKKGTLAKLLYRTDKKAKSARKFEMNFP